MLGGGGGFFPPNRGRTRSCVTITLTAFNWHSTPKQWSYLSPHYITNLCTTLLTVASSNRNIYAFGTNKCLKQIKYTISLYQCFRTCVARNSKRTWIPVLKVYGVIDVKFNIICLTWLRFHAQKPKYTIQFGHLQFRCIFLFLNHGIWTLTPTRSLMRFAPPKIKKKFPIFCLLFVHISVAFV